MTAFIVFNRRNAALLAGKLQGCLINERSGGTLGLCGCLFYYASYTAQHTEDNAQHSLGNQVIFWSWAALEKTTTKGWSSLWLGIATEINLNINWGGLAITQPQVPNVTSEFLLGNITNKPKFRCIQSEFWEFFRAQSKHPCSASRADGELNSAGEREVLGGGRVDRRHPWTGCGWAIGHASLERGWG